DRCGDGSNGVLDRAPQIAAADAVLDRNVARVPLAIDLVGAVGNGDSAQLRQRHALAGRCGEPDAFNRIGRVAILGQVAHHQVVASFAVEHLAEHRAADGGLHGVLDVADVDLVARGLPTVDHQVEIRLADDAQQAEVLDAFDLAHRGDDRVAHAFESVKVIAVDLDGELAFDPADGFLHVVGDRL